MLKDILAQHRKQLWAAFVSDNPLHVIDKCFTRVTWKHIPANQAVGLVNKLVHRHGAMTEQALQHADEFFAMSFHGSKLGNAHENDATALSTQRVARQLNA